MTNLDIAFNFLITANEGSKYVNDPDDSGGPTRWGVTKKTYERFFGHLASEDDIRLMPAAVAKQIYAAKYWAPLQCGKIWTLGFAVAFFDTGALYGTGTTAVLIQRALSLSGAPIKLDGVVGDKTIGFLNMVTGGGQATKISLMHTFHGLLLDHIEAIIVASPKDEKYRRGWTLRAGRLLSLLDDEFLNRFKQNNGDL